LECGINDAIPLGWLVWLVGTIAATCTAFYMTRLVAMTFWGQERFRRPRAPVRNTRVHAAEKKKHGPHTITARTTPSTNRRIECGSIGKDLRSPRRTIGGFGWQSAPRSPVGSMWVGRMNIVNWGWSRSSGILKANSFHRSRDFVSRV
jgi:hypothetical protein